MRSFTACTSETGGDIALVRAVLPSFVSNAYEWLTAVRAGQLIFCFGLAASISVPPCCATLVRAEPTRSMFVLQLDGLATLFAYKSCFFKILSKPITTVVGFYRIFRNRQRLCNTRIGATSSSHFVYYFFLFGCHELFLQSEDSCPQYPLEKKKPIVQKKK
jgi:hypothetical protein